MKLIRFGSFTLYKKHNSIQKPAFFSFALRALGVRHV